MAKPPINIQGDFSELAFETGKAKGMALKLTSQSYLSDLVDYAHGELSRDFDQYVEMMYQEDGGHARLHHVFEWGVESRAAKLWRHRLTGQGANKNATWEWMASKKAIPTPDETRAIEGHPMQAVPDDLYAKIREKGGWAKTYWFHWKAPVMEYGGGALIQPQNEGGTIMYPTGDIDNPVRWSSESWTDPGGEETTGAFTTMWVAWWSIEGPEAFYDKIAPGVERNAADSVRLKKRRSKGQFSIGTITDYNTQFAAGQRWAMSHIESYQRRMRLNARRERGR